MKPYYDRDGVTIYHGDARELLPSLADGSIDFIFTDPPYGHDNANGDLISKIRRALGDKDAPDHLRPNANDGTEDTARLIEWALPEFARLLPAGACCCCCCCCGGGPDPQFARWSLQLDEAFTVGATRGFKQMVVWDKGPMGMGWHYRRSYETVLVAEKPGAACRWYDLTNKVENIIRHIRKVIPTADEHPTPKPVALPAHFIALHTKTGDIVLDPFMGGGSTVLAARYLGRRVIACEIEERWIEILARELEQPHLPFYETEAATSIHQYEMFTEPA